MAEQCKVDPRSTAELFQIASALEYDADERWNVIRVLHHRGTLEVLNAAQHYCSGETAAERQTGADVLAQLGVMERTCPTVCVSALLEMLTREQDRSVLHSIGCALGHHRDPRVIAPLCELKQHWSSEVRYGVVHGLTGYADEAAINALIDLSRDVDADVRNWATFGLGSQIELDTPEIRKALWDRTADMDEIVRGEALVGLAKRRDNRVVDLIIHELQTETVDFTVFDAAEEIGDPRLCPHLEARLKVDTDKAATIRGVLEKCRGNSQGQR